MIKIPQIVDDPIFAIESVEFYRIEDNHFLDVTDPSVVPNVFLLRMEQICPYDILVDEDITGCLIVYYGRNGIHFIDDPIDHTTHYHLGFLVGEFVEEMRIRPEILASRENIIKAIAAMGN